MSVIYAQIFKYDFFIRGCCPFSKLNKNLSDVVADIFQIINMIPSAIESDIFQQLNMVLSDMAAITIQFLKHVFFKITSGCRHFQICIKYNLIGRGDFILLDLHGNIFQIMNMISPHVVADV